eukprot:CAMPEP_0117444872 /NCGR_PEP_ID=MMETSP0759-20121206/5485_1 /TAXON_ID=63605 /ORGANISM="Percolomonas cosmopolitus, Strain WS" /LENGTH=381 /DNA_ID=CAMNT_0005236993 /DNA_START=69 /DNA_END=1214 /DNA_ORIENTATION=+
MVSSRPSRKAATKATAQIKKKPVTKKAATKNAKTVKASKTTKRQTTKKVTTKKSSEKKQRPKKEKVEKDPTAVVIADVEDNLEMLFKNHVSKELLVELLQCNNVKVLSQFKKDNVVAKLMETTMARGQQVVVDDKLSKKTLNAFIAEVKGSEAAHPNNKGELRKELRQLIEAANGFDEAVKKLKVETIDAICEDLGFKEDGDRKDKVEGLTDETRLLGAKALFDRVQYRYMQDLCEKCGLSKKGQKEHLVARFLGQSYRFLLDDAKVPPKEKKEKSEKGKKKEKKEKKEKPKAETPDVSKIQQGVSDLELHQYYTAQLQQYLKDNELKKGKNKKEMVKIIQSFLNGDESVLQKNQVPKTNKKRKRGAETEDNAANKKQKTA